MSASGCKWTFQRQTFHGIALNWPKRATPFVGTSTAIKLQLMA